MSKAAVLGGTGVVGAGGAALVGAHQLGAFGSYGDDYVGKTTTELLSYNGKCLDRTFGKGWSIPSNVSTQDPSTAITWSGTSTPKGCLALNWEKEQTKNVWGGNFRFVWAMAKDRKGFVVYLKGDIDTTVADKMKMKFVGVAYVMEENSGKWTATNKLALKEQEIAHDKMNEIFPVFDAVALANGSGFSDPTSSLNFLDHSEKVVKAPGKGETARKNLRWEIKGSDEQGSSGYHPWTNRFDKWWEHFFGKDKLGLPALAKTLKNKWEVIS